MKKGTFFGLVSIIWFCSCNKSSTDNPAPVTNSDSATVTVVNGYGGGKYKIGDTVHIWSNPTSESNVFDQWTGYASLLQHSGEWHNAFVMPAQNVNVTANLKAITPFTLKYEKIKGVNIAKNVYYYFPASQKGVAFLLNGSNGSALHLVSNYEWGQMIKDLVAAGYGVVVTESEESSLGDLNGNGSLQWKASPIDSTTNVDLGNIKALRDTFYARGYTNKSVPLHSMGMSNGGAFSSVLSHLYKFKSGVSYCAQAYKLVFDVSTTPFQFCMAKNDERPEVGAAGNADALTYSQGLNTRGVCSKYFLTDRSPVYPERFARRSDIISVATSTALFKELKNNNWLTDKNFLKALSDSISKVCLANAAVYPTYNSLNLIQRDFVNGQIDVMFGGHQFFSDLNKTTIKFLDSRCQ